MPSSSQGGAIPGAVFSQLALQRQLFDSLIKKISANASLLLALQQTGGRGKNAPASAPRQDKILFLSNERSRHKIRELIEDSRALGAAALELEADFQSTANAHIIETRASVVHLIEVAGRHSAFCSPELIEQIKTTIDNANLEIERMQIMTEQISQAAASLLDPVQQVLAVVQDV
ncbi:MAG: hypothetical protein GZ090_01700 [Oxalobacteraceae bacterium]|nr:hypothetical protein [Oxalobacteraceae bacterium]